MASKQLLRVFALIFLVLWPLVGASASEQLQTNAELILHDWEDFLYSQFERKKNAPICSASSVDTIDHILSEAIVNTNTVLNASNHLTTKQDRLGQANSHIRKATQEVKKLHDHRVKQILQAAITQIQQLKTLKTVSGDGGFTCLELSPLEICEKIIERHNYTKARLDIMVKSLEAWADQTGENKLKFEQIQSYRQSLQKIPTPSNSNLYSKDRKSDRYHKDCELDNYHTKQISYLKYIEGKLRKKLKDGRERLHIYSFYLDQAELLRSQAESFHNLVERAKTQTATTRGFSISFVEISQAFMLHFKAAVDVIDTTTGQLSPQPATAAAVFVVKGDLKRLEALITGIGP